MISATVGSLLPRYVSTCVRCDLRATLCAQSAQEAQGRFVAAGWRDVTVRDQRRGGIGLCPLCVAAQRDAIKAVTS